jgi:hypothetical protein
MWLFNHKGRKSYFPLRFGQVLGTVVTMRGDSHRLKVSTASQLSHVT